MASKELFHLLRVLDERDTGLGKEDVACAFEPAKRAESEEWVKTYLSPATLLTKEEFAFQDRFGEFTPQINSAASGRPLSDEEFEHAISALESSTAAIDAQCQIMEAQKRALLDFKARNKTNADRFESLKPQHKLARDKAQLDLELGQISSALHERLRSSMAQAENASTSLPSKVERLLEKDDRLLDGLQKIVPKLQGNNNNNDSQGLEQIDQLCHAFITLEAKAIRTQINTTYTRNLPFPTTNGNHPPNTAQEQEHQAARAELADLSSEIDSLLALVAETHYRRPITTRLSTARASTHSEAARWSNYLASTLHYLAARLDSLAEHFTHLHAHRAALAAVSQTLDKTLAFVPSSSSSSSAAAKGQDAALASQSSTSKLAQAQRGLKPLRLVQANLPEAPDASAQLLRLLDIRLADAGGDVAKLSTNLHNVRLERHDRLMASASNTDEGLTKVLGESLNRADVDARDLVGAVFAHSQYGERRLVDEDVQRELDVLEGRTQTVGEQMRQLDVDGLANDVRKLQRSILTHSG